MNRQFFCPVSSSQLDKKTSDIPSFLGIRNCFNNNTRQRNMIAHSVFLSLFYPILSVCLHLFFFLFRDILRPPQFLPKYRKGLFTQHRHFAHLPFQEYGILHNVYLVCFLWAITSIYSHHPCINIMFCPVSVLHWDQVPPKAFQSQLTWLGYSWAMRKMSTKVSRK